jgi:acyl-CoA thioesterase-1
MPALDPLLVPFWLTTTMHRESVVFIARDDGVAEASLLFPPETVLSVTNTAGDVAYGEGTDYLVDRQTGRMIRPPASRMPEVRREMIVVDPARTHRRLVAVTYTHAAGLWTAHARSPAGVLSRVRQRLHRREPLTICLTGDSISEGYDASGFRGVAPYQPAFGPLIASGLEQIYGGSVQLHNLAAAGWTAADALWDTARVAAVKPDLVIVAFGMNDACYAKADEFVANVSNLLQGIRDGLPGIEFVVVSPMLPTPECTWVVHSRFDEYRAALADLIGDEVVFADVTGLWTDLVARKNPHDLSGNGLNHPNDFGHRLYTQTILALLAPGRH